MVKHALRLCLLLMAGELGVRKDLLSWSSDSRVATATPDLLSVDASRDTFSIEALAAD